MLQPRRAAYVPAPSRPGPRSPDPGASPARGRTKVRGCGFFLEPVGCLGGPAPQFRADGATVLVLSHSDAVGARRTCTSGSTRDGLAAAAADGAALLQPNGHCPAAGQR